MTNPPANDRRHELIDEEICAYQTFLDQGGMAPRTSAFAVNLSADCQSEWKKFQRTLDLLHQHRSSSNSSRSTLPGSPQSPGAYQVPSHIGRFPISRQLGSGGCGIVFLGVDREIGRHLAIKIPRAELLGSQELINRFLQEAKAVSQLEHPNILPVYESQSVGLVPYLVMPYIAGGTLARWLTQSPLVPFQQAAEIARQLAEGLAHSHDRGVLHRDVKPGNVLLATPDTKSVAGKLPFVPKLTDFGLAKCASVDGHETRTGTILGTACYMAPEQAKGRSREITALTDVYSLGAVLYEMLAGGPPFRGVNGLDTIQLILHRDPPSLRLKRSGIPHDLDLICRKCLEKDPRNRYPSARALADDLQRFLNGEPIEARPPSFVSWMTQWRRRHPVAAVIVMAAVSGLVTLTSLSLWYNSRLVDQLQIAEQERQAANRERQVAREQEQIARQQALTARRRAYVADMHNAGLAWDHGDTQQTLKLLNRYQPRERELDLRDFAWWYLWREYSESSRVLGTHQGWATAVAITRRGNLAASGGIDSVIKLWTLPSGELVRELHGHERNEVKSLDFSPAGDRLVSTGVDGTVRIWDVETGQELSCRRDHQSTVVCALYSRQGDLIASGGDDQMVRLWSADTGEPVGVFSGHTDKLRCLAFHPTERTLASGDLNGSIRFWNLTERGPDQRLPGGAIHLPSPDTGVRGMDFEPNGRSLIVGTNRARVLQYSLEAERYGEEIFYDRLPANPLSLVWPRDGDPLFAAGNTVRSINPRPTKLNRDHLQLCGHLDRVVSLAASEDGGSLVSAARDNTVRYWPRFQSRSQINEAQAKSAARIDDERELYLQWCGRYLAADYPHQELMLFRMPEGELVRTIPKADDDRFLLSPEGRLLFFCKDDGQAACLRVDDGQKLWTDQLPAGSPLPTGIHAARFAIDASENYVILGREREMIVVSLRDGTLMHRLSHSGPVHQVVFLSRPGKPLTAISTCTDGKLRFWDVQTGALLKEHQAHTVAVFNVEVSADQQWLATGGMDRKVRVWRVEDLQEVAAFPCNNVLASMGFLKGASMLAVWHSDAVHFWSVRDEAESLTYKSVEVHGGIVISPDGKQVAIPKLDGIILLNGAPKP